MKLPHISVLLFLILLPIVYVNADDIQETEGDNSPAIKAGGDVIYNNGLSKKEIKEIIDYFLMVQKSKMEEWKTLDRYQLKNGLVRDTKTGLMWMRCSIGKTWKNSACQGNAKKYLWDDVMKNLTNVSFIYAGYDDWRLPTMDELPTLIHCGFHESLMHISCEDNDRIQKIMMMVFPDADYASGTSYWWAYSDRSDRRPSCNDYSCFVDMSKKSSEEHYVRLVREDH